jgi:hypothetical protein
MVDRVIIPEYQVQLTPLPILCFSYSYLFIYNPYFTPDVFGETLTNRNISFYFTG